MKKVAVVYWSGTGNTLQMANAVADGVRAAGAVADVLTPGEFTADMLDDYHAFAFGCPSMGCEQLEETEFAPIFAAVLPGLSGRSVALFGSYGWGDGEWMRSWEVACADAGAVFACPSVICCETPDEAALAACNALGRALGA